ncbi:MAG: hypothetical protein DI626_05090 [Micavibrio aeruginosavorus]|uniref:Uncharacterized protein n=1 Tax=Micavibrio aeruginosavorus TaxID=349221 RepID=A0A2W5BZ07_9BACT|nr:MAG: hypothetical protein DI626_05090 [Micavibrio aeruginosavorus]
MNIAQKFGNAAVILYPHFPATQANGDYLVVTKSDLHGVTGLPDMDKSEAIFIPLTHETEANEALNSITTWMIETSALSAAENHASHIGFYKCSADGEVYASLRQDFYAEDFLFPDRRPEHAQGFDDLMRMLDRDRLGDAMLESLANDFGMRIREEAPMFWRRDIRICNHPDKIQSQEAIVSMKKNAAMFSLMPARRVSIAQAGSIWQKCQSRLKNKGLLNALPLLWT